MKIFIFSTLLSLLTIINGQVKCPDPSYQCPDGQTCCPASGGGYGCCPLEDAVCCSDNQHCCPEEYICIDQFQICVKCPGVKGRRNFTIKSELLRKSFSLVRKLNTCPECPDGETCCPMGTGEIGCCPFPNAVCCSDEEHCCPEGYTCDSSGYCTSNILNLNIPRIPKYVKNDKKLSLSTKSNSLKKRTVNDPVQCPDGAYCDSGNTCCLTGPKTYGCCPFPNAVCCSDELHCCPNGMTCDSSGYCTNGPDVISWFEKKPTIKRP